MPILERSSSGRSTVAWVFLARRQNSWVQKSSPRHLLAEGFYNLLTNLSLMRFTCHRSVPCGAKRSPSTFAVVKIGMTFKNDDTMTMRFTSSCAENYTFDKFAVQHMLTSSIQRAALLGRPLQCATCLDNEQRSTNLSQDRRRGLACEEADIDPNNKTSHVQNHVKTLHWRP